MASDFEAGRSMVATRYGDLSCIDLGDGPVALFVHGVVTNAYLWRNVIETVGTDRRCVAIDLPGHGRSPVRPDQDLSLNGLADAVVALCDALDLTDIDLVAHDTGGAVAQIAATRDPSRWRTLTLTNCDTHDNVPPEAFKPTVELAKAGALAASAALLMSDMTVARDAVFAIGYENPAHCSLELTRTFLEPVLGTPEHAQQFERLLASMDARDLLAVEPALERFDVPTLVVWATDDEFFDLRWAYWLRDTIPGVTNVVELQGAKLFFPEERGVEFAGYLQQHWNAARAGAFRGA